MKCAYRYMLILVIKENFIKAWSKLVLLANGRRLKCGKLTEDGR